MRADTRLPPYLPYLRFLLQADLTQTAKLLYALLLDRAMLSQANGWLDEGGRIYLVFSIEKIAAALDRSPMIVKTALSELEETDWLAAWRQFFTPVCCGNHFVVLPPWLADTQDFPGRTPILIEPKSAFGTGHHATTALCLRVVSDLLEAGRLQQGQHFLDLGTGSGVLGIGCCKFGLTGEGLDIDPLAVDNAVENRALNAIAPENFTVAEGSIGAVAGKQFDLVLANILARPLTEMAADIVRACRPGGCLVLSGLLEIQADGVTAAYKAQGLPEPRRIIDGEWAALVWDSVK